MTRPPAPPRFCISCGDEFALSHCRFCPSCQQEALTRKRLQNNEASRRRNARNKGIHDPGPSGKYRLNRYKPDQEDFAASSAAIAKQIAWMEHNHLLPPPNRDEIEEDRAYQAKADAGRASHAKMALKRSRTPVRAIPTAH
jgi:hypothetical protein